MKCTNRIVVHYTTNLENSSLCSFIITVPRCFNSVPPSVKDIISADIELPRYIYLRIMNDYAQIHVINM